MKDPQDYIKDITEMRSMMERSSKFLALSGLSGIMAGVYALAGAAVAYFFLDVDWSQTDADPVQARSFQQVILLALTVLLLAVGTAVVFAYRNASRRREKFWNSATRQLVAATLVPLVVGGLLMLVLLAKGLLIYLAPCSLIFYGLAMYNAGRLSYGEMKSFGLIQAALGLICAYYTGYALLCWAIGFGLVHIIYGIYMHYRYER